MEPSKKTEFAHLPVLCRDVVAQFDFPGDLPAGRQEPLVVDATLGLGGHTQALLERYPHLSVLGVEWDAEALEVAEKRLAKYGGRFRTILGSYADLPTILQDEGIQGVSGILVDLGVSSLQLDNAARGFSFSKRGPFDMRMSKALPTTAWDLLSRMDVEELASLFKNYGEEPHAMRVAETLKEALERKELSNDSWAVAQCIRAALPAGRGRIDPATRCFQAFRMAVNHELENVKTFLEALPTLLKTGGRAVVLSFHSLEDRMVKQAFKQADWARLITKKAIQASWAEKSVNPRARSVRMRALEKI